MSFLPKGYQVPEKPKKYIKPSDLEGTNNKFRALSSAIMGYVWFVDKKPTRIRMGESLPLGQIPLKKDTNDLDYAHFWSFVVWNYQAEMIQIMEIKQASIQKELTKYIKDEDYGDLTGYDFVLERTGTGLDTRYAVTVKPPKVVSAEIAKEYANAEINLDALYDGADPFNQEGEVKQVTENKSVSEEVADDIPF